MYHLRFAIFVPVAVNTLPKQLPELLNDTIGEAFTVSVILLLVTLDRVAQLEVLEKIQVTTSPLTGA